MSKKEASFLVVPTQFAHWHFFKVYFLYLFKYLKKRLQVLLWLQLALSCVKMTLKNKKYLYLNAKNAKKTPAGGLEPPTTPM